MRRSTAFIAATLPLLFSGCGGTFITSTHDSGDAGPDGEAGSGAGGRATGGRASTGGRATGGRLGTGGRIGTGGFGPGGFFPTGGFGPGGSPACLGIDCSFLDDQCNRGACIGGSCQTVPIPDNQPCDDGSLCTSGDVCSSGVCIGSGAVGCPQPANACQRSSCDPGSGSCVLEDLVDGEPCGTTDPCSSGGQCFAGTCVGSPASCGASDGCCPSGCDPTLDSDCVGSGTCTNLALNAVASSSGGGVPPTRGPEQMIDGLGRSNCGGFHWIFNGSVATNTCGIPPCEWIELEWPNPVTIASMYIETEPGIGPSPCGLGNRNIAGGDVQYFANNQWQTIASLTGLTGDPNLDFGSAITTNRLRVANVVTGNANTYNSVIYEWHVYAQAGCKPPP